MRNIFLFIRRYFNFLFFVVMQLVALYILFNFNRFHEAAFLGVASEVTGKVNARYNNIEYYFKLKKANEALVIENEQLRNQLRQNFDMPDTSRRFFQDTLAYDTLGHYRKWWFMSAKVINNSINFQNNYFTVNRGAKQGVRKDMGVISPTGVAGTIITVSDNMAIAMSLLNSQSRLSAKLKKSGETGQVFWDGKNPNFLTMVNLPKSMQVNKGDTIITSQYSTRYPLGIMVGSVAEVVDDKSSNFYTLKIKTATDFYNLEHATVVENLFKEEQKKLEDSIKTNE
ncbi:rod shape-determining protein MreC [Paraflavitalea sp. CAU 1676]|uniref:rod shape-determining protein MreC n=1 Tax=Paraflavitalea sp. CAU 1676 TaxID=3032598 RepID=UPI0023DC2760|nr:rod shape-determining protein MreC [Paraflavitalea sp. CAU 1676]MDF2187216.1 rod shape-determining protein MreC [Paraflavitalea sp. CAU 1676]